MTTRSATLFISALLLVTLSNICEAGQSKQIPSSFVQSARETIGKITGVDLTLPFQNSSKVSGNGRVPRWELSSKEVSLQIDLKGRLLFLRDSRVATGQSKKYGFKAPKIKPSLASTEARLCEILRILKAPTSANIVTQKDINMTLGSDKYGYFGFKVETPDKKFTLSASFDHETGFLQTLVQFYRN